MVLSNKFDLMQERRWFHRRGAEHAEKICVFEWREMPPFEKISRFSGDGIH